MTGDNGVYIGVRHWTHEAALIREFLRAWNKDQIARLTKRRNESALLETRRSNNANHP